MYRRTFETHFIRSTQRSRPKNEHSKLNPVNHVRNYTASFNWNKMQSEMVDFATGAVQTTTIRHQVDVCRICAYTGLL